MDKIKITVINGPNLDFLGIREPGIYGTAGYSELEDAIEKHAEELGVEVVVLQSNSEGDIIDYIHYAAGSADGIIINPAAYTHYSYAIADALAAVALPAVEVHISNIHKREEFRHKSVTAPLCIGQICGLGFKGYTLAMDFLAEHIKTLNLADEVEDDDFGGENTEE